MAVSKNSGVSKACCIRGYDSRYVSEVWFGLIPSTIQNHGKDFLGCSQFPWNHDSGARVIGFWTTKSYPKIRREGEAVHPCNFHRKHYFPRIRNHGKERTLAMWYTLEIHSTFNHLKSILVLHPNECHRWSEARKGEARANGGSGETTAEVPWLHGSRRDISVVGYRCSHKS